MMRLPAQPIRDHVRLKHKRRLAVYGVGLGLWLTGILWLVFHYFMVQQTTFGPSAHPLEHWLLALHGLFGFATLWILGLLWGVHIVGGWKTGRRRVTGSVLFVILAELTITGYLLYYPPSDDALSVIALSHWGVGLAIPILFLLHRLRFFGR